MEQIKDMNLHQMLEVIQREKINGATMAAESIGQPNQKALSIEDLSKRFGIERRFADITFESIERRGIPQSAMQQYMVAKKYAEKLEENLKSGTGLFFRGGVGTMKTTLSIAIMREAIKQNRFPFFVPMVALMDKLLNANDYDRSFLTRRIKDTSLLVIDDLGGEYEDKNGWLLSKIDALITERYNNMKPVIITTNLSNKDFVERYNLRILDRVRSTCVVVNCESKSFRPSL